MIFVQSKVKIIDNSGALEVGCIRLLKESSKKGAKVSPSHHKKKRESYQAIFGFVWCWFGIFGSDLVFESIPRKTDEVLNKNT